LGLEVLLVDRRPHMGGALDQHDRWFPTDDCSWCKTLPLFAGDSITERCLRRQLDQPGIDLAPSTVLDRIAGEAGHFTVTLKASIDVVDPDPCTACDKCAQVCPVEVPDEFDVGLSNRKAAYIRHPLAVPSVYSIDMDSCTRCGKCPPVCPTGAIDFVKEDGAKVRTVNAKSAIITTGFEALDPRLLPQYRWGEHPDVYTNAQFERHVSGFQGLKRRSDGRTMKKVAILHCIGSRDVDRDYCSSACCLVAAKQALTVKELVPDAEVTLFYMDMRDQVRDGYAYHQRVRTAGIRMVRARPSAVEIGEDDQLNVVYADEGEGVTEQPFDAVVLQMAQVPSMDIEGLADAAGVDLDSHGFIARSPGTATATSREGVFVAGSAAGPKDIPDTVIEAASAAMEASKESGPGTSTKPQGSDCPAKGRIPATAVLVCLCHGELEGAVDVERILAYANTLPSVVAAKAVDLICKVGNPVTDALGDAEANRLVILSCPDYQWRSRTLAELADAGIQRDLVEFVDVREWLAWVNPQGEGATQRAQSLVAMSTERLRTAIPRAATSVPVDEAQRALVIGGGVAGMVAALDIATAGFDVDVVEKRDKLGGNVLDIPLTARGAVAKHLLNDLHTRIVAEARIDVLFNHELVEVAGAVGAFHATVRPRKEGEEQVRTYGAIILATGGARNLPKEYRMRELDGVVDQFGLEDRLVKGQIPKRVVMVQCAGSREDGGLPYCSRVCCTRAIHNARRIIQEDPDARVTILNRDIVTYGTLESFYTVARDEGVRFMRFDIQDKPVVERGVDAPLQVQVHDPGLDEAVVLDADLVVLSTGMVPRPLGKLPQMLRTGVDEHGFLASPNIKFRPVDAFRDGVYACGLTTGPKIAEESMASAHAAASRALAVLWRSHLPVRVGISTVNSRTCSACGLCVSQCPFSVRYLDPKDGKARVDEAACWGCGVCAQACPNAAASMATRSERQAIHQVDAAVWHD
jgi:heterodisulfide reductase subunit A